MDNQETSLDELQLQEQPGQMDQCHQMADQSDQPDAKVNASMESQVAAADPTNKQLGNRTIDTHELSMEAGFEIKPDGKSHKYPMLKVYYEFGPWVGRNRKAICVRCKHTSASSQPERLIRHLRKCVALSDDDRQIAEELLHLSNANKKKRKMKKLNPDATDSDESEFGQEETGIVAMNSSGPKRLRRDHPDRKKHIDQCLVRFIFGKRIPIKYIHSKEFLEFVQSLDPDYQLPSRETIANTLIPGLFN